MYFKSNIYVYSCNTKINAINTYIAYGIIHIPCYLLLLLFSYFTPSVHIIILLWIMHTICILNLFHLWQKSTHLITYIILFLYCPILLSPIHLSLFDLFKIQFSSFCVYNNFWKKMGLEFLVLPIVLSFQWLSQ